MAPRKVLIPLDGSEFSRSIIPHVCRLLNPNDYDLLLVQVTDEPKGVAFSPDRRSMLSTAFVPELAFAFATQAQEPRIYASQEWETAVVMVEDELRTDARELERVGYAVEVEARLGEPAEEICACAKEHAVDFVAMATHGRTGLRQLALGSVATHVVRHAGVPVLLVSPFEADYTDALLN